MSKLKLRLLSRAAILMLCSLLLNNAMAQTEPGSEVELVFRGGFESAIAEVAIIYFTVNDKSSELLPTGATATISWYTSNAYQCNASTTPASSLDDWTPETVVGFSGDQTVTFPAVGDYTLYLDCLGSEDNTASATVDVRVNDLDNATITAFTVTPDGVVRGTDETLTLAWDSTDTSAGCSGSANWPDSADLLSSGSRVIGATDFQADTQYSLTCSGLFSEDTSTADVTVIEPVAINYFTVNDKSSELIQTGALANMSWSTSNANQCNASTTPVSSLDDWSPETVVGSSGDQSVTFPAVGDYILYLDCLGAADSTASASVNVQVGNPDNSTITAFTVTPDSVVRGTDKTLELTWNSTDTSAGCSGSANWPNSENLPSSGLRYLKVTDFQADTQYSLTCSGLFSEDSSTVDVTVTEPPNASITAFTVTPDSVVRGTDETLTLAWNSTDTSGCYGSDNWPNSADLPSSGSRFINVTDFQADTQYSLTCTGLFSEDSLTVDVTVTEPQVACDVTLTSAIIRNWESFFLFNTIWPGPQETQKRVTIPEFGYYAVRFYTGSVVDAGQLTNIEASGTVGTRFGSVSETPGCFDVADECKYVWGRSGGIIWDTTGTEGRCQLKPRTTYYWNMTFTDGVTPGSSTCAGTFCDTYLKVYNDPAD